MNELALPELPHSREVAACIRFEGNRLVFDRVPTKEELQHVLALVKDCNDFSTFWVGDLLLQIKSAYGEDYAKEAAQNFYQPELALEAMRVVEHLDSQRFRLSWAHHKAALQETASVGTEAIKWLKQAEENQWSPAELRDAIRKSGEVNETQVKKVDKTLSFGAPLRQFTERLRKVNEAKPIAGWTYQEVNSFLNDTEELRLLIEEAHERFEELVPQLNYL